jgi:dTDP-4-amino-4,6-dideoxygalactose transaminase
MFDKIRQFEQALAAYTGAPYVIMTDCCTHAIELCLRHERPGNLEFTAYTYLSIPMLMHKLSIPYQLISEDWTGEYRFHGSRVWDSARRLERGMYRSGQMQCLSFGHGKPLQIGRGGAILLDDARAYDVMIQQRYDGRDLNILPWQQQKTFRVGYHYRPTIEEAEQALELLPLVQEAPRYVEYPDCRNITIIE